MQVQKRQQILGGLRGVRLDLRCGAIWDAVLDVVADHKATKEEHLAMTQEFDGHAS